MIFRYMHENCIALLSYIDLWFTYNPTIYFLPYCYDILAVRNYQG